MQNSPKIFACSEQFHDFFQGTCNLFVCTGIMFKLTIMTGHFASEASGPQKLQKYILRDFYASSLGKKTFLKVRVLSAFQLISNSHTLSKRYLSVANTTFAPQASVTKQRYHVPPSVNVWDVRTTHKHTVHYKN